MLEEWSAHMSWGGVQGYPPITNGLQPTKGSVMLRLFCWSVFLVLLMAFTTVFARELPPQKWRTYISQFPIMFVGECQVEKLSLPMMPCAVYYDEANDVRYVVLSADKPYVTHIYVLDKEGVPYVIWIRSDKSAWCKKPALWRVFFTSLWGCEGFI